MKIKPKSPPGKIHSQICVCLSILARELLGFGSSAAEVRRVLTSPDGRIQVSIQMPATNSAERPRWSATFRGSAILSGCGLGLQTAAAGELMAGVHVVREHHRSVDHRIPVLFGKSDHADDRFHETRFTLETPGRKRVDVVFRCYDDAIALCYELPNDSKQDSVTITDETTSFAMEGNPTAYAQYLENYTTSHEHNVTTVSCSFFPP